MPPRPDSDRTCMPRGRSRSRNSDQNETLDHGIPCWRTHAQFTTLCQLPADQLRNGSTASTEIRFKAGRATNTPIRNCHWKTGTPPGPKCE
eukprot:10357067-Alexandrium_andersonii.AAC.1